MGKDTIVYLHSYNIIGEKNLYLTPLKKQAEEVKAVLESLDPLLFISEWCQLTDPLLFAQGAHFCVALRICVRQVPKKSNKLNMVV